MERSHWIWPLLLGQLLACSGAGESFSSGVGGSTASPITAYDAGSEAALDAGIAPPPTPILSDDAGPEDAGAVTADAGAACTSNEGCREGQFCRKTACDAAEGTCTPKPSQASCEGTQGGAACGCDHETYPNECWAAVWGANVASQGECVLPSGSCTSQADCGGPSYAGQVYCATATCGATAGTCMPVPGACNYLESQVCGCDGKTYYNACFAKMAQMGVSYGGPCRSGAITACNADSDCNGGQMCVPDPRGCNGSASCPGVCATSSGQGCDASHACTLVDNGPPQECAATTANGTGCVYTTGAACSADAPCAPGQLCLPSVSDDPRTATSACIMP